MRVIVAHVFGPPCRSMKETITLSVKLLSKPTDKITAVYNK